MLKVDAGLATLGGWIAGVISLGPGEPVADGCWWTGGSWHEYLVDWWWLLVR